MKRISVSAPGKLHLLGEHAIVWGKPAILTAIDRRCVATLTQRNDAMIHIVLEQFHESQMIPVSEVCQKAKDALRTWEQFSKTNDTALLKSIAPTPPDFAAICIGIALNTYGMIAPNGFDCTINSSIPLGGGFGSSGAFALSIVGAISVFLDKPFDKNSINDIAYTCEQVKHGFVSGGDSAAECFGGLIWFQKLSATEKRITPLSFAIPEALSRKFVCIDTGKPVESTGEMVSLVRTLKDEKPEYVEKILDNQEQLVRELVDVIKNNNQKRFSEIIRQGEHNLESLGVVSPAAQMLIRDIEKQGGAAKICGGGGKTKGTGIVLGYHDNPHILADIAATHEYPSFTVQLGCNGIQIEE